MGPHREVYYHADHHLEIHACTIHPQEAHLLVDHLSGTSLRGVRPLEINLDRKLGDCCPMSREWFLPEVPHPEEVVAQDSRLVECPRLTLSLCGMNQWIDLTDHLLQ